MIDFLFPLKYHHPLLRELKIKAIAEVRVVHRQSHFLPLFPLKHNGYFCKNFMLSKLEGV